MQTNQDKTYVYWREELHKKIHMEKLRGRTVLDVGCGTGEDAFYLSQIAKKVHAFDIEKSDMWKDFASSKLSFSVANAYKIPFEDNSFNGVFLKDVLHHVSQPEKVLQEIKRVAKKGSYILIIEGNRYNPIFYIHMTKMRGHEHLARNVFMKLIKKYFRNAEFFQFESHYIPFLPYPLYVVIEGAIEASFTYVPLLNRFKSYNLAIIKT